MRLVLSNLSEVRDEFKESQPGLKFGFSKLSLRPGHCVIAAANGSHSVCVCAAYQNIRLILKRYKLAELMTNQSTQLSTYHHCLVMMKRIPLQKYCFFHKSVKNVLSQTICNIYLKR
jgi:hypothetical protein